MTQAEPQPEDDDALDFLLDLHARMQRARAAGDELSLDALLEDVTDPDRRALAKREFALIDPSVVAVRSSLNRDFEILREIGRGGMGAVYEARDRKLGRRVAIKIIAGAVLRDAVQRARFEREAQVGANLEEPGICRVYGSHLDEDPPFVVMELLEGRSLASILDEHREAVGASGGAMTVSLPAGGAGATGASSRTDRVRSVVRLIERVARTLEKVHATDVIHRDVKPSNIMVKADGSPVLLDFGIASIQGDDVGITKTGAFVGTPAYMSPQQLESPSRAGVTSDVFSLGVTLFECLAGFRPFTGSSQSEIEQAIRNDPVPDLLRHDRSLSPDLVAIVEKALERDLPRRYATMAAMGDDLAAWLDHRAVSARRAGYALKCRRFVRRNPVASTAAAIIFVILLASTVVFSSLYSTSEENRKAALKAQDAAEDERAAAIASRDEAVRSRVIARDALVENADLLVRNGAWKEASGLVGTILSARSASDHELHATFSDSPGDLDVDLAQAAVRVAFAMDDRRRAQELLKKLESSERDDVKDFVTLYRGDFLMADSANLEKGRELVESLVERETNHLSPADLSYARGLVCEKGADALARFEEAVRLDPTHHRAWTGVTSMLFFMARLDDAVSTAIEMRTIFPDDTYPVLMAALARTVQGRDDAARRILDEAGTLLSEAKRKTFEDGLMAFGRALANPDAAGFGMLKMGSLGTLSLPTTHHLKRHLQTMLRQEMLMTFKVSAEKPRNKLEEEVENIPDGHAYALIGASHAALMYEAMEREDEAAGIAAAKASRAAFHKASMTPSFIDKGNRALVNVLRLEAIIAENLEGFGLTADEHRLRTWATLERVDLEATERVDLRIVALAVPLGAPDEDAARRVLKRCAVVRDDLEIELQLARFELDHARPASALAHAMAALRIAENDERARELKAEAMRLLTGR